MHSVPYSSPRSAGAVCDSWIGASFLEAGDCQVVFAHQGYDTSERVEALGNAQIPGSQHAGTDRDGLLRQGPGFRQLGGVAAEEREIVGAFRIVGRLDSKIRLTQLEGLPQVGLAVLLIPGGVFEESQAVHAAGGLFGAGSGGQGQTGDANRLF